MHRQMVDGRGRWFLAAMHRGDEDDNGYAMTVLTRMIRVWTNREEGGNVRGVDGESIEAGDVRGGGGVGGVGGD